MKTLTDTTVTTENKIEFLGKKWNIILDRYQAGNALAVLLVGKTDQNSNVEETIVLTTNMRRHVKLTNDLIDYVIAIGEMPIMTSADLHDDLPAKLRTQIIQDVRSIHLHCMRYGSTYPTIKRPIAKWERQVYGISENGIALSLLICGKVKRILIPASQQTPIKSDFLTVSLADLTLQRSAVNTSLRSDTRRPSRRSRKMVKQWVSISASSVLRLSRPLIGRSNFLITAENAEPSGACSRGEGNSCESVSIAES